MKTLLLLTLSAVIWAAGYAVGWVINLLDEETNNQPAAYI